MWLTLCHPTFHVLPALLQVFLEAGSVVAAELFPEAAVLTAELSLEVVSVVAELSPEVVSVAAELSLEVVSVAAELSPEVVVLAAEPEVVSVADLGVSEPEVVFVAVVSVADVAEPPASVDIAVAFAVLVPVSAVVVEVDSSGRPRFCCLSQCRLLCHVCQFR